MSAMHVAALQLALSDDIDANIAAVSALVREAAGRGAKIILPPELFEGHYFCQTEEDRFFARAKPVSEHKAVQAMQALAAELKIYIPTRERTCCSSPPPSATSLRRRNWIHRASGGAR